MELLTITQFAALHNVSNQAIEYAIKKGKFKKTDIKIIAEKKFIKSTANYSHNENMGPK